MPEKKQILGYIHSTESFGAADITADIHFRTWLGEGEVRRT